MTCHDAEPLIVRYADDEVSLAADVREALRAHLQACAACRAAVVEQRDTAALLRARPPVEPRPGLVARVSARIDREGRAASTAAPRDEWFGAVNWRAWTVGVIPVAAALVVAAYIDIGSARSAATTQTAPSTIGEWLSAQAPAAAQSSAGGDALIEAVLTGVDAERRESDVR